MAAHGRKRYGVTQRGTENFQRTFVNIMGQ